MKRSVDDVNLDIRKEGDVVIREMLMKGRNTSLYQEEVHT